MAEQQGGSKVSAGWGRRVWFLFGAALFLVGAAALWLWHRPASAPLPVSRSPGVGIVDVQAALRAHPAYAALATQRAERERLETDLLMGRQSFMALTSPGASSLW